MWVALYTAIAQTTDRCLTELTEKKRIEVIQLPVSFIFKIRS